MHLCITPPNYQPIKAECLLLSHYMDIRSRSESMSRERGRKKGRVRVGERGMEGGRRREERGWSIHSNGKCTVMQEKRDRRVTNKAL